MKNFAIAVMSTLLIMERLFMSCTTGQKLVVFAFYAIGTWITLELIEYEVNQKRRKAKKAAAMRRRINSISDIKKAD